MNCRIEVYVHLGVKVDVVVVIQLSNNHVSNTNNGSTN